jgi:hypothetical protein
LQRRLAALLRRPYGVLKSFEQPWWRAKAIRVLEAAGGRVDGLIDEAGVIEARLGLVA